MTGRERILAAFTPEGTPDIGVVASYEDIFIRDHYADLTSIPWWDSTRTDCVARDFHTRSGLEWFAVEPCASRAERARRRYEQRGVGVWLVDPETGRETRLQEPTPSGTNTSCSTSRHTEIDALPTTHTEVDALVPLSPPFDRSLFMAEGRHEVAASIRLGTDLLTYSHISSPVWSLYSLLGYEGMMILLAQNPDLALYAAKRILENTVQQIRMISALGADAIWIEECLTDQIGPELFRQVNLPILRVCVQEIRTQGMKSIYYYCGDPWNRLDAILGVGADAIHFEEGKKGFTIDIEDIVGAVRGRCVVFGNLDAIGVLQDGSNDGVREDVNRLVKAGRANGSRFVMSTGSPITPGTPVERVRRYTALVRDLVA